MSGTGPAVAFGVLLLIIITLLAGLFPVAMPLGLAAGGVLETGQAEPARWWFGATVAVAVYLILSRKLKWSIRLWWLAMLVCGLASAISLFVICSSWDQPQGQMVVETVPDPRQAAKPNVAILSALPLFWPEGGQVGDVLANSGERSPLVPLLTARPLDKIESVSLSGIDILVIAQPRLLHPEELVALDAWVRGGGNVLIFADPLLMWPSRYSLGDPRRPPLTSLLDPLLIHWGLRLEPVAEDGGQMERRMLSTGHVLIMAGASRFSLAHSKEGYEQCVLREHGLMALCRIGAGKARLVADADLLDDRLWLASGQWPERPEAYASDIVSLLRGWAVDPLGPPLWRAPRRVTDEAALVDAMRLAIGAAVLWAWLGWIGLRRLSGLKLTPQMDKDAQR